MAKSRLFVLPVRAFYALFLRKKSLYFSEALKRLALQNATPQTVAFSRKVHIFDKFAICRTYLRTAQFRNNRSFTLSLLCPRGNVDIQSAIIPEEEKRIHLGGSHKIR